VCIITSVIFHWLIVGRTSVEALIVALRMMTKYVTLFLTVIFVECLSELQSSYKALTLLIADLSISDHRICIGLFQVEWTQSEH
jgi:hypothetical protein